MLYFDNSATTPIDQDVQSLMSDLNQNIYGNPSSIYASGRNAKNIIEIARRQLANAINSEPSEIIFTGGGSEANNIVLWDMVHKKRNHVITSSIEHPAIPVSYTHLTLPTKRIV